MSQRKSNPKKEKQKKDKRIVNDEEKAGYNNHPKGCKCQRCFRSWTEDMFNGAVRSDTAQNKMLNSLQDQLNDIFKSKEAMEAQVQVLVEELGSLKNATKELKSSIETIQSIVSSLGKEIEVVKVKKPKWFE